MDEELIFNPPENRYTVPLNKRLEIHLSTDEWTHVKFKQPKFSAHSFDFDIVDN